MSGWSSASARPMTTSLCYFLEGEEVPVEDLDNALCRAVLSGQIAPVLCSSGLVEHWGDAVARLPEQVCAFAPGRGSRGGNQCSRWQEDHA